MKIEFGKKKLKKQLSDSTELKKNFGLLAKKIRIRLDEIEASPNLAVLMQIPAANCHSLKGDRKDEWAVDISRNDRMIFEILHNPVPITEDGSIDTLQVTDICINGIEDYH